MPAARIQKAVQQRMGNAEQSAAYFQVNFCENLPAHAQCSDMWHGAQRKILSIFHMVQAHHVDQRHERHQAQSDLKTRESARDFTKVALP